MSRYAYAGKEVHHKVVVGWDNPLETFFAQVLDTRHGEDSLELWIGTMGEELQTVEELAELVRPYGEIPEETVVRLREDHARRTPPSPTQLLGRSLFETK